MLSTEDLEITRPDDWHLHLRDGPGMKDVVQLSARQFGRAIIMPNLKPPIVNTKQALSYRERILAALPERSQFTPLMTLYLTDGTTPDEIAKAKASGAVAACKLYPAGATTNSENGVTDIARLAPVLEAMQRANLPLLVHGEVTDPDVDIFDREQGFIESRLRAIVADFPELRVVFEHVTTAEAVDFVRDGPSTLGATITPHHLLYNRNAILAGGIRPHFYCLPVLKRERHRQALLDAATSGHPRFFLGTDSAPHPVQDKESACGCAGAFSAHAAVELYAKAFEAAGALDRLEAFASHHGADFYGLPRNTDKVRLRREVWEVPADYPFGDHRVVPLGAEETLAWRLVD
ncbi:dihydroorotase [Thiorhodococcus mannitoliphagus]|uniref:Dihydroorotase n=1 Tax=Thiorhodococcus mannitoliphagus TaxID=329406 RepID=A0A6P1DTG2_9GAMM|nr:dihydroorotase [Thiorhodococcus mannitoliphagus]NEX19322.1 dihydroorotase [Thiorhodococcus mannitoliphagus]